MYREAVGPVLLAMIVVALLFPGMFGRSDLPRRVPGMTVNAITSTDRPVSV